VNVSQLRLRSEKFDDDDVNNNNNNNNNNNKNGDAPEICSRERGTKQNAINESHPYSTIGLIQNGFYPRQLTRLF